MLSRCIVAAAVSVMAIGGAGAQTATDETPAPGKPIPLLQIVEKSQSTQSHLKTASRQAEKASRRVAARKAAAKKHIAAATKTQPATPAPAVAPTPNEAAAPADPIWAAVSAPAANGTPFTDANVASAAAPADPPVDALVVDGQTVKIASPDEVNEMDLAANSETTTPDAALKSDFAQVATADQASAAAPEAKQASAVGSASWIAKVLAALGGAVAAGSAAWFLIGSAPQRTYT